MDINWLYQNTVGPLINLFSTTNGDLANQLAQQVVVSSNSALIVIWADQFGGCGSTWSQPCRQTFNDWVSNETIVEAELANDQAWLLNWVAQIDLSQASDVILNVAATTLLKKAIGGIAGPVSGQVASILEAELHLGPYASVVTANDLAALCGSLFVNSVNLPMMV